MSDRQSESAVQYARQQNVCAALFPDSAHGIHSFGHLTGAMIVNQVSAENRAICNGNLEIIETSLWTADSQQDTGAHVVRSLQDW